MTATKANRLLAGLFLLICAIFIIHEVREKPRVFILDSYHAEYSWSKEVAEGVNRVFDGKHYTVQWHYMDTKRHPDPAFKQRAVRNAQQVIDQWRPNVVIAVADNAQLAMAPYIDDPDINIVFSGVFAELEQYGYDDATNVTGIQERWPLDVLRDGLETVFVADSGRQLPLRVHHIGDRSPTGLMVAEDIVAFDWGERLEITSESVADFVAWKHAILRANEQADVVLFSLYHTIYGESVAREVMAPEQIMQWTHEHLTKPGVGGWGFYVEHGGMMAIGVSAYEQGEEAARLATLIIDEGRAPAKLAIRQSKQFLIYLRESLLSRYGVTVPRIYEAFARANDHYYP